MLEATKLIKAGKIYRLGINLEPGIPLFGQRHLSITIPGGPTSGPFGDQKLMFNDEMFNGEIGQVGSQFDGLGHIGIIVGNQPRYYNGFTQEQVGGAYGLKKLGVHNVKPFFTRGILLDILALKGGERLPIGYVITVDDIKQALAKQNVKAPGEGDVVLFHTGHIKLRNALARWRIGNSNGLLAPPPQEPPQHPPLAACRAPSVPRQLAGAARSSAVRGAAHFDWCWTGVSAWGRGAPQGCPGGTASGWATWEGWRGAIAHGIAHAQRDETPLRCAHVASESTHDGVG